VAKKLFKQKQEPVVKETIKEIIKEEALVIPVVETNPVEVKVAQEPILKIEEIARGFRQYRPHHLQAIISFCNSRGYPLQGTKAQLLNTLAQFGW
jgi:hypothetical protein